jgi:hypothetical protein
MSLRIWGFFPMPCLAGTYDPSVGLLIPIAIFPAGAAPTKPIVNLVAYPALVDTGASCTCISKKVITDVGLVPHTKLTMASASGNHDVNAYMFLVGITTLNPGMPASISGTITGNIHTFSIPVQGIELLNPTGRFDVLLGMDILAKCSLKLDLDKHYSLCW